MNFKPMLRNPSFRSNDSFDNFDRRFNFMWKLFWVFFGFVFVGIIVWYLFIGTVAVKLVDKVQDNGLKSIVEQVWEGPHAADTK